MIKRNLSVFDFFVLVSILTIFVFLALTGYVLIYHSAEAIKISGISLFNVKWDQYRGIYGLAIPLLGSLVLTMVSLLFVAIFSIPLAILTNEYVRGRFRGVMETFADVSAGLPTVIYAFIGVAFLSNYLGKFVESPLHNFLGFIPLFSCTPFSGANLFTASIVLSIAMTPFTILLIREAYSMIPKIYIDAAYSLGLFKEEVIFLKLSMIKKAIISSLLFSASRVLTETTIVSLVAGGQFLASSCLLSPVITIPALIVNNFGYSNIYYGIDEALYFSALILFLISMTLNILGFILYSRWKKSLVI
jgi:phosphate transport system permease protein